MDGSYANEPKAPIELMNLKASMPYSEASPIVTKLTALLSGLLPICLESLSSKYAYK